MSITITPNSLTGTVTAPPSKSMTHRLLITSALAEGTSILENPLESQDTGATSEALRKLGIVINETGDKLKITGGTLHQPSDVIDCRESGTTLRLLTGICSIIDKPVTLSGAPQLLRRPNKELLVALTQLGVKTESSEGYPPITVQGGIKGGKASIRGDVSSQFISSIILAAPYADDPVDLSVTSTVESKPYIEMTLAAMRKAGISPETSDGLSRIHVPVGQYTSRRARVEGDWSSASYMLAAGVLGGKVHVDNLDTGSKQADIEIIRILDDMGAYMKLNGNRVSTERSSLSAIDADLSDCPDLFPMVACLCAVADGTSRLSGLSRLRLKESDRLSAVRSGLERMGINVKVTDSTAEIKGGTPQGASIDSFNDHRIAMSFAVLAQCAVGETRIENHLCVDKSYPDFWRDLEKIGARYS